MPPLCQNEVWFLLLRFPFCDQLGPVNIVKRHCIVVAFFATICLRYGFVFTNRYLLIFISLHLKTSVVIISVVKCTYSSTKCIIFLFCFLFVVLFFFLVLACQSSTVSMGVNPENINIENKYGLTELTIQKTTAVSEGRTFLK